MTGHCEPSADVRFVRLVWCDSVGLRRTVPFACLDVTKQRGLGLTRSCMAMQIWADACAAHTGLDAVGEVRLMPAGDPIRLPWHPQHAICLTDMHDPPGTPWSCCPRSALARTIAKARAQEGLDLQAGFETEFNLGKPAPAAKQLEQIHIPVDASLFCDSAAFDAMAPVLDSIADSLERMGVGLVQMHAESGCGQFEVATQHSSPLEAADQLLLTREAVTCVAARAGFEASLHPMPDPAAAGNSCHCHLSLQQEDGRSLMDDGTSQLGARAAAFFAGVLAHLPSLMVFTMPCIHSYRRMRPGAWAGAYRIWGAQNKEAPLRLCFLRGFAEMTNMELKSMDSTSNPYIALAAIITAGLLGMEKGLELPAAFNTDPSSLSSEEIEAAGLEALPTTLAEALQALNHDSDFLRALRATMGPELLMAFIRVKVAEAKTLHDGPRKSPVPTLLTPWSSWRIATGVGELTAAPHAHILPVAVASQTPPEPPKILQELSIDFGMYWDRTPAAVTICSLLQALSAEGAPVIFDHIAFRTIQAPGFGIDSIATVFTDFGYERRDQLDFPSKNIRAFWYSPPDPNSKLPRIFISELKVEKLSQKAQSIIGKYLPRAGKAGGRYAAFCAATGVIPWGIMDSDDYDSLLEESEYAAWTLTNGYAVNHTTVAVHRLQGWEGGLNKVNEEMTNRGFPLNLQGGVVKTSPDGFLLQSATVAERVPVSFSDGSNALLPGAYIEFAERMVLPQFQHLKPEEVREEHRRDGFEPALFWFYKNFDLDLKSTASAQLCCASGGQADLYLWAPFDPGRQIDMGQDALAFNVNRKKTPFQRHKEKEEDKKKRADAEAAKLYQEFEQFFGDSRDGDSKSFVRGGTIQPGSRPNLEAKKASSKYVPSFLPPAVANIPSPAAIKPEVPMPATGRSGGKPRNIDIMLQNLKRDQEAREERQRLRKEKGSGFDLLPEDGLGSFDDGDPFTTNLYVGNLAPEVDEEVLRKEFARFGVICSVKVMWPRDDDQRRRGRNCGFVAYTTRESAQNAKDELNGIMLRDNELKIGWGKAVTIPPAALAGGAAPALPLGLAALAAAKGASVPPPGMAAPLPWANQPQESEKKPHDGNGPDIEIKMPADANMRFIIDSMAVYILQDGPDFEQAIMAEQADKPEFKFLFDLQSAEHAFYVWRIYSLASGDSLRSWRIEPFVLLEDGPRFVPPLMTLSDGSHQTAAQRGGEARDKDKPLSELQRDRFEDLLRGLTVEKADICEAMVFALDNAECAFEIVEILTESLTLAETPPPTKVSRLFLVSDILHNSTAPVRNASRYRSRLEAVLPNIFESFQEVYLGLDSRITQEALRRHILRVLRVWRERFIFNDDFLNGLQACPPAASLHSLTCPPAALLSIYVAHLLLATFLSSVPMDSYEPSASGKQLAEQLESVANEDLEVRCRRNGLSTKGGKPSQITRLVALQSYLNGDEPQSQHPGGLLQTSGPELSLSQQETLHGEASTSQHPDDQPVLASLAAYADEAEAGPEATVERVPEPIAEPVSKWTLVDPDAEAEDLCMRPATGDSIFSDDEEAGPAPAPPPDPPATEAAWDSPAPDLSSPAPAATAAPSPDKRQAEPPGAQEATPRDSAAEEERRQRLRQVEVAVIMFREDLEDQGLSKEDLEGRVAGYRAKLVAAAEKSPASKADGPAASSSKHKKAAKAKEDSSSKGKERDAEKGRSKSSREHDSQKAAKDSKETRSRDKDRDRDREKDRERERERDRLRELEREKASSRRSARDEEPAKDRSEPVAEYREPSDSQRRRDRSRSRSRDRERERDRAVDEQSRDRDRDRGRERERDSSRLRERERDVPSRGRSSSPERSRAHERSTRSSWKHSRSRSRSRSRERPIERRPSKQASKHRSRSRSPARSSPAPEKSFRSKRSSRRSGSPVASVKPQERSKDSKHEKRSSKRRKA
ncbi:hypothetical protein WJX84_002089 [Apatococcus fuscideae]|uniref:2-oxoadipate dioxygenase/decarboxylase n=1 Tax=Apatococcus fuscideae TaxID=2026836 RepID=A0AAW1T641_9CHLO